MLALKQSFDLSTEFVYTSSVVKEPGYNFRQQIVVYCFLLKNRSLSLWTFVLYIAQKVSVETFCMFFILQL